MKDILTKKETEQVLDILEEYFPDAKAELNFSTPYELLVATILSAQCTDVRVNKVTEELFKKANTPDKMLKLGRKNLEKEIHSCGFYNMKSKNIMGASEKLILEYGGEVPSSLEELMSLPGVGRKTANVVRSVAFGVPAIAVDTHVFRCSNRLGIVNESAPEKTEEALMNRIKKDRWSGAHHLLIFLGRRICKSQKPQCENCPVFEICMKKI